MNRKHPYKFAVYIPPEKEHTIKKFIEIAKREGKSASTLILDYIHAYVQKHEHGNPQLRIDKILEASHTNANRCSWCKGKAEYKVFINKRESYACKPCLDKLKARYKQLGFKQL